MPTAGPASFVDLLEHHAFPALAAALRSRIDAIMTRWEESVRRLMPTADKLTFLQLRNDSLAVLRQLADALASTDPAATAALLERARQHAAVRFQEQYDLRELMIEYRLLRRIILEEVEPALPVQPAQQRGLSLAEQVVLHMGIDAMLQRAVLAFVDHREDRLRAVAQKAAATAEQAKAAVAIATEHARAAVAIATEQAKVAAAITSDQARDAAWATAEQDTAAAWATAEQATAAAWAIAEQAKDAAAVASEQARAAVAVVTEQDRVAAAATSEQATAAAWAMSEEDKAVAAATSEQARVIASALSEQAAATAAAASQVKDHFLAVLSHELRNPLTPVLATVSLLQLDESLDPEMQAHLEVIRRNAELEARLIDDLLDVTRISRGKVELDRRPVELGTILHHAVEVCQPDIEARRLHFDLIIKDPPHHVHADAGRLQQVFWNILKNAVKFTPRDGCVGMQAYRHNGSAVVEVHDSGLGMDPEALTRVFNAFEQVERTVTRQFGGLGLGLAISKALVELHGGTITAHSEGKGKGARFIVRLPLIHSPAPGAGTGTGEGVSERAGAGSPPQATGDRPPVVALRILLVEDHGDTARIMRLLLARHGHEVQTAGDLATALDLAGQHPFDLLLSDLGLPDGSGLDLLRELRTRGHTFPAIALSGYGQDQDVQQSLAAGFGLHLTKPVDVARLDEAVAALTAQPSPPSKPSEPSRPAQK